MKSHIFMSSGFLVAAIFFMRSLEAMSEPTFGLREIYILGGFIIAALLFRTGWKDRKAAS